MKSKIRFKLILSIILIIGAGEHFRCFPQVISEHWLTDIEIVPHSHQIIFATTINGRLFRSQDNGDNWQDLSQMLPKNIIIKSLTYVSGAEASTDNSMVEESKKSTQMNIVKEKGTLIVATKHNGLFYSLDLGKNWSQFPSIGLPCNYSIIDVIGDAKGRIFIGTEKNGVFSLKDSIWVCTDTTQPEMFMIKQLLISPQDLLTLYAVVPHGIYRLNEAEKWDTIQYFEKPIVNAMLIDPKNPKNLYIGTKIGMFCFNYNEKTKIEALFSDINITTFTIDALDKLYVGTAKGFLYTFDDRESWELPFPTEIASGSEITVLKNIPSSTSNLLAGTSKGLYITKNNGSNWQSILPSPKRLSILFWISCGVVMIFLTIIALMTINCLKKHKLKKVDFYRTAGPETFAVQIQEAFDSLKRSELPDKLLEVNNFEKIYVDYRKNLESFLQPRNDYIIGNHGTGKTLMLCRAFMECKHTWERKNIHRHQQFLKSSNVIATYLSLKDFELTDISNEDNYKTIERQFVQTFVKNMQDQMKAYPSFLGGILAWHQIVKITLLEPTGHQIVRIVIAPNCQVRFFISSISLNIFPLLRFLPNYKKK